MCGGGNGGDPEEKKRNDEIDKQIRADRTRLRSEVKLLLLGTLFFSPSSFWPLRVLNTHSKKVPASRVRAPS